MIKVQPYNTEIEIIDSWSTDEGEVIELESRGYLIHVNFTKGFVSIIKEVGPDIYTHVKDVTFKGE
jgi:hypothetical protein